jgi:hypothetical protein
LDPFYDLSLSIPYTQQLREKIAQRQEKLKMKSVIQVKESLFTKFGSLFGYKNSFFVVVIYSELKKCCPFQTLAP